MVVVGAEVSVGAAKQIDVHKYPVSPVFLCAPRGESLCLFANPISKRIEG